MTSTNFCYFLQGYLELNNPKTISKEELDKIKGHLKLAFMDDIDPSMGDKEHQEKLNTIHNQEINEPKKTTNNNILGTVRC